ncbi:hypothetical protein ACRALDRAFT_1053260 [Sodiomyces alcalophilus JCM 7366]|uniref:uncharacterized protein n=1 Tax=Sodiomyces alcalophilus JCM 7366 TaxID=591952 RepID=UPI0039B597C6
MTTYSFVALFYYEMIILSGMATLGRILTVFTMIITRTYPFSLPFLGFNAGKGAYRVGGRLVGLHGTYQRTALGDMTGIPCIGTTAAYEFGDTIPCTKSVHINGSIY